MGSTSLPPLGTKAKWGVRFRCGLMSPKVLTRGTQSGSSRSALNTFEPLGKEKRVPEYFQRRPYYKYRRFISPDLPTNSLNLLEKTLELCPDYAMSATRGPSAELGLPSSIFKSPTLVFMSSRPLVRRFSADFRGWQALPTQTSSPPFSNPWPLSALPGSKH